MLSSEATALDHNSWVSARSLYLSKVVPTIYIFFAYSCILSNRLVILLVGLLLQSQLYAVIQKSACHGLI